MLIHPSWAGIGVCPRPSASRMEIAERFMVISFTKVLLMTYLL
jgi:hypothetical protein